MAYGSYDFGDVKKEMGEKKGFGYLVCSQWHPPLSDFGDQVFED